MTKATRPATLPAFLRVGVNLSSLIRFRCQVVLPMTRQAVMAAAEPMANQRQQYCRKQLV